MNIIKKNLLSIICGVIAILAIVALFWPAGNIHDDLAARMLTRQGEYNNIVRIAVTKKRHEPGVLGPASILADFPSVQKIAVGLQAEVDFSKGSMDVYRDAVRLSEDGSGLPADLQGHKLLVPHSLPKPDDDATAIRFRELYPLQLAGIRDRILNSGSPPTEDDYAKDKANLWETKFQQTIIIGIDGKPQNTDLVNKAYEAAASERRVTMREDVARERKIYVTDDAMMLYGGLDPTKTPDAMQIWQAQMLLWINQDISSAIASVNAHSTSVLDAPIKQLVKLDVPPTIFATSTGAAGAITAPLPQLFSYSATGRVPCVAYDVVRFNMVLNIDASKLSTVLQGLSANRFLTVLQSDVTTVPPDKMADMGFAYGDTSAIQLNLDCEYLYLRDWTVQWMPPEERKILGIPPDFRPHDPELLTVYTQGAK